MEPAQDFSASAPAPVFVDDTGRRRVLTRRAGRILVVGFTTYIGLLVIGFARDPRVGPIQLPSFGLPTLGLAVPPVPSVLGEQTTRAEVEDATTGVPADAADAADRSGRGESSPATPEIAEGGTGAAIPGPLTSAGGSTPRPGQPLAPVESPAGSTTTTTTADNPGDSPKSSTTTTSTTAPTSTSTTTATSGPGQGSGEGPAQGKGPDLGQGPDGTGAPGQQRRPTTTTLA